jgi:3-phosphoglycerate kinase
MAQKLSVRDVEVGGRRVLARMDFNVPLATDGSVVDNTRIRMAVPTIKHIVEGGGRAVLMSHLGRPNGRTVSELRMRPVASELARLTDLDVSTAPDCVGDTTEGHVARMKDGGVLVLENLRFHVGETKNESDFARRLARLGDIYVNDAFGTAHRAHASTVGVTQYIEVRAMGFLMERELEYLSRATQSPKKPYVAILGGAKVSDKIGVIENLMAKVDAFLIGGAMAFTFLAALGKKTGDSLVEPERLDVARKLIDAAENAGKAFLLPGDVLVARDVEEGAESKVVDVDGIEAGWKGVDIGPRSIAAFSDELAGARTVAWNGPLGVFEIDDFSAGTRAIAGAVAKATDAGAVSIVGGGDTAAAVAKVGLTDRMTHVSTGGGASLAFLEGSPLPAVEALSEAA